MIVLVGLARSVANRRRIQPVVGNGPTRALGIRRDAQCSDPSGYRHFCDAKPLGNVRRPRAGDMG
jgi:hypothetical protein